MEDNKNYWRTITDDVNGTVHVLTNEQIKLVQKLRRKHYISEYIKNKDYSIDPEINPFPMNNANVPKRRFMPSENERMQIKKIIHAMKMGWIKEKEEKEKIDPV